MDIFLHGREMLKNPVLLIEYSALLLTWLFLVFIAIYGLIKYMKNNKEE
ncbi:hypothetical protein JCM14244_06370 [Venenivibrio stagnispumantis]|uniref:Uncharacterized protein n=1 Tax=Venenivibrio stagnispumantis TaxID=407998 RepID=A0AA45WIG4_9AQUI|nr:hypothetical protein [Venenivibrio stagnispumantis]MCW4572580.1 hypothetical protein [Venenivibrio stagnispumantis]SMP00407.1 hypothetical protein SAMN06264868_10195 [Venenivibrio stagnispumantis]